VSKAVLNHLRHRSQRVAVLKRSPSTPHLESKDRPDFPHRLRRFDSDTCLLPTLASGLDLLGHEPIVTYAVEEDPASSFHTLPPEDDNVGRLVVVDSASQRRLRTESGAFVVSVEDAEPQFKVIITDVDAIDYDAISNTSLQTMTRYENVTKEF